MICLDSDVLIEIVRGRLDPSVFDSYANEKLCTTSVSVYERLVNVTNKRERGMVYTILNHLYVLPLNSIAAVRSARLYRDLRVRGQEIGQNDTLIAGIMQTNNCEKIITRNKKHFARISGIKAVAI